MCGHCWTTADGSELASTVVYRKISNGHLKTYFIFYLFPGITAFLALAEQDCRHGYLGYFLQLQVIFVIMSRSPSPVFIMRRRRDTIVTTEVPSSSSTFSSPPLGMCPPKLPLLSGSEESHISYHDFHLRFLANIKMYFGSAVEWLLRGLTGVARREVTMFLEENSKKSVTDILAFLDQRFNPDTNIDFLLRDFYSREQQAIFICHENKQKKRVKSQTRNSAS
jgi:hypothetical protein